MQSLNPPKEAPLILYKKTGSQTLADFKRLSHLCLENSEVNPEDVSDCLCVELGSLIDVLSGSHLLQLLVQHLTLLQFLSVSSRHLLLVVTVLFSLLLIGTFAQHGVVDAVDSVCV